MEREALSSYDRHELTKQLGRKEDLCTSRGTVTERITKSDSVWKTVKVTAFALPYIHIKSLINVSVTHSSVSLALNAR